MMNTVANNIQLCITSQSRKINNLALNLKANSVSALRITSLRHESADPGDGIPQKNFCCIPPNSSHRYGVLLWCYNLQRY